MSYKLIVTLTFCFIISSAFSQNLNAEKEIKQMTLQLCNELQNKGPVAWLDYFEETKNFFMVNDGKLALAGSNGAKAFITDTLAKIFTKINLSFTDLKVDMLCKNTALIASPCHEILFQTNSNRINFDGYVTAVVDKIYGKWKFRNLHWSSEKR